MPVHFVKYLPTFVRIDAQCSLDIQGTPFSSVVRPITRCLIVLPRGYAVFFASSFDGETLTLEGLQQLIVAEAAHYRVEPPTMTTAHLPLEIVKADGEPRVVNSDHKPPPNLLRPSISLHEVLGAVRTQIHDESNRCLDKQDAVQRVTGSDAACGSCPGNHELCSAQLATAVPDRPRVLDKRFGSMANLAAAEDKFVDSIGSEDRDRDDINVKDTAGHKLTEESRGPFVRVRKEIVHERRTDDSGQDAVQDLSELDAKDLAMTPDKSGASADSAGGAVDDGKSGKQTELIVTSDPLDEDYVKVDLQPENTVRMVEGDAAEHMITNAKLDGVEDDGGGQVDTHETGERACSNSELRTCESSPTGIPVHRDVERTEAIKTNARDKLPERKAAEACIPRETSQGCSDISSTVDGNEGAHDKGSMPTSYKSRTQEATSNDLRDGSSARSSPGHETSGDIDHDESAREQHEYATSEEPVGTNITWDRQGDEVEEELTGGGCDFPAARNEGEVGVRITTKAVSKKVAAADGQSGEQEDAHGTLPMGTELELSGCEHTDFPRETELHDAVLHGSSFVEPNVDQSACTTYAGGRRDDSADQELSDVADFEHDREPMRKPQHNESTKSWGVFTRPPPSGQLDREVLACRHGAAEPELAMNVAESNSSAMNDDWGVRKDGTIKREESKSAVDHSIDDVSVTANQVLPRVIDDDTHVSQQTRSNVGYTMAVVDERRENGKNSDMHRVLHAPSHGFNGDNQMDANEIGAWFVPAATTIIEVFGDEEEDLPRERDLQKEEITIGPNVSGLEVEHATSNTFAEGRGQSVAKPYESDAAGDLGEQHPKSQFNRKALVNPVSVYDSSSLYDGPLRDLRRHDIQICSPASERDEEKGHVYDDVDGASGNTENEIPTSAHAVLSVAEVQNREARQSEEPEPEEDKADRLTNDVEEDAERIEKENARATKSENIDSVGNVSEILGRRLEPRMIGNASMFMDSGTPNEHTSYPLFAKVATTGDENEVAVAERDKQQEHSRERIGDDGRGEAYQHPPGNAEYGDLGVRSILNRQSLDLAATRIQATCRRRAARRVVQERKMAARQVRGHDATIVGLERVNHEHQHVKAWREEEHRAAIVIQTKQRARAIQREDGESIACRDARFRFGPGLPPRGTDRTPCGSQVFYVGKQAKDVFAPTWRASRSQILEDEMGYRRSGQSKLHCAEEAEAERQEQAAVKIQAHARRRAAAQRTAEARRQSKRRSRKEASECSGDVVAANNANPYSTEPWRSHHQVPGLPITAASSTIEPSAPGVVVARKVPAEPLAILRRLRDPPKPNANSTVNQFRLRVTIRSAIEAHKKKTGALRGKPRPLPTLPCWRPNQTPGGKSSTQQTRLLRVPLARPRPVSPLHKCVKYVNASLALTSKQRAHSSGPTRVHDRLYCALFAAESLVAREYARADRRQEDTGD